jgi:mycoredoxin
MITDNPTPRRAGWLLLLVVVGFAAVTKLNGGGRVKPVFCDTERQPTSNTVVMLSASWCGYCAQARKLFVTRHIDYCEYDIETSPTGAARHQALGVRGVPVILIKNDTLLGFERDTVLRSIAAHGLAPLPR